MENTIELFMNRLFETAVNEEMLDYDYQFPKDKVLNYVRSINSISMDEYVSYIVKHYPHKEMEKSDFAQFSDPKDATYNMCNVFLSQNGKGLNAYEIGRLLLPEGKKHEAYRKYGEGSAKAATEFGLLSCFCNTYFLSCLGKILPMLNQEEQQQLIARLVLRTTEMRQLIIELNNGPVNLRKFMKTLTDSTYVRRRSTFRNLEKLMQWEGYSKCTTNLFIP